MNTRTGTALGVGVGITIALAGCSQGSAQGRDTGASANPASSATSPSTPASGATSGSRTVTTSSALTATSTGTVSSAAARCSTGHLRVSLAASEGAAGSVYDTVRLENTGGTRCSLSGYPGVSLVGHGNGTQIGASARRDKSATPRTVTVAPGASTTFVVRLVQAGNYPRSTCSPTPADGFRIYPPGDTAALYLPLSGATGCAKATVELLTVRPVGAPVG
jgi:uncharacterized cupredoxin-like copper-binding protein